MRGTASGTTRSAARRLDELHASSFHAAPNLYGYSAVYNWIGEQSDAAGSNLAQIGINYNDLSSGGTSVCKGNNDVDDRPMILTQSDVNDTYSTPLCFPQYIFGAGTITLFEVSWYVTDGKNMWDLWVNWNNTWESLATYQVQDMYPSNAQADFVPAEVQYYTSNYAVPDLPSIPDADGQIDDNNVWEWWTSSLAPGTQVEEAGDYCMTVPEAYTNVTASNC
jgi:hypothetical protein